MSEQNYKNHSRFIPLFHYVTSTLIVAVLTGSIVNLVHSAKDNFYSASLLVAISLILVSLFIFARSFALRAQDRAIRAEENFRHYLLTGKPFDSRIRMSQIIALRFASDEEFSALTQRAISEGMKSSEIKKAIKSWRADHHRA